MRTRILTILGLILITTIIGCTADNANNQNDKALAPQGKEVTKLTQESPEVISCKSLTPAFGNSSLQFSNIKIVKGKLESGTDKYIIGCVTNSTKKTITLIDFAGTTKSPSSNYGGNIVFSNLTAEKTVPFKFPVINPKASQLEINNFNWQVQGEKNYFKYKLPKAFIMKN